jgi:hypothetical protein
MPLIRHLGRMHEVLTFAGGTTCGGVWIDERTPVANGTLTVEYTHFMHPCLRRLPRVSPHMQHN